MNYLTSSLLFLCILLFSSFKPGGGDKKPSTDYFVTKKGDTTYIYGDVRINGEVIVYKNEKGKDDWTADDKIENMFIGNRVFKSLPTFFGRRKNLQEIITYSNKYVLTNFTEGSETFMYIWTNKFENVQYKIDFPITTYGRERKVIAKYIVPYFGSCKDLMDKINTNMDSKKYFIDGIANYHCCQ